jgi:hypothetical protein
MDAIPDFAADRFLGSGGFALLKKTDVNSSREFTIAAPIMLSILHFSSIKAEPGR